MRKGITTYEHGGRKAVKQIRFCRIRYAGEIAVAEYCADTRAERYANARAVIRADHRAVVRAEFRAVKMAAMQKRFAEMKCRNRAEFGIDSLGRKWQRCR